MKSIKKSKKGSLLFMVCTILAFISGCAHAQNNSSEQQVIDTIKKFYVEYNTVWATDTGVAFNKNTYLLQKKYCTDRLIKEFKKYPGHDPLTNDESTDTEYLKTLTVRKDSTKLDTYIVSYIAHGYGSPNNKEGEYKIPQIIHVRVVKEKGAIKIDSVW